MTRLGHDDDGDTVLREIPRLLEEDATEKGDIDLQALRILMDRSRSTRHTYVVTYRSRDGHGVRANYDWENSASVARGWHVPLTPDRLHELREALKRYAGATAIYLSPTSVHLDELVAEVLGNARLRFLETSTAGGTDEDWPRLIVQARSCTHVLASPKFIFRLLSPDGRLSSVPEDGTHYTEQLLKDPDRLKTAHHALFQDQPDKVTVATLGAGGAVYYQSGDSSPTVVKITSLPPALQQMAWIGCGDVFRGVFISRILAGDTLQQATECANNAAAERTTRLSVFKLAT